MPGDERVDRGDGVEYDASLPTHERLRSILEASLDAIVTIDERGIVLSFNPSAERMFGYTAGEIVGRNVSLLMPSPDRERHDEYIARYLRTGEPHVIGRNREVTAQKKDGTPFPIYLSVAEIPGPPRFFTGIVRNLSEIRQAREEIVDAQNRLVQSERLSAIGQAMTGLAHEARNALARSEAALRMLSRRTEDRPELVEYIQRALRAQNDLQRLFEEVRQYAAPLKLDLRRLDVRVLVREAWEELAVSREGRDTRLVEVTAAADAICRADEFALRRVFRNILDNSLQSCPDPVLVTIEYSDAELAGKRALRISISDRGPGIPPGNAERLFEAFFTTRTRGTGLGLAIVRRIVESHGGSVRLGPSQQGATFIIELPRGQP